MSHSFNVQQVNTLSVRKNEAGRSTRRFLHLAILLILFAVGPIALWSQDMNSDASAGEDGEILPLTPHKDLSDPYRSIPVTSEAGWDSVHRALNGLPVAQLEHSIPSPYTDRSLVDDTCQLDHIVFGWYPYWSGTAYRQFDFSLLSDISYFSYEVNPTTGSYTTVRDWKTTPLVDMAHTGGTRVNLCVTLFSQHALLFSNETAVTTLIDSLVALVKLRNGDGVNIDFEGVPSSQKANLTAFMQRLGNRFHTEIPGSQISIALPAVDWSKTFDVAAMDGYVDLFIIMGYGYHYGGSSTSGPIAPKNSGTFWNQIDLTRSINYYLGAGVPAHRLVLGLPWYGYDWATATAEAGSPTLGSGTAKTYAALHPVLTERTLRWDRASSTPWFAVEQPDSTWRQTWYDDEVSLGMKYDLAIMKGLAGIGIWALGYDGGFPEMWDAIESRFKECGATPGMGEITDMGGSLGPYHPNDRWSYTIAPAGATQVLLNLGTIDLADDHLYIHDGPSTASPLIASYTGTDTPPVLRSTGGSITLSFESNRESEGSGFVASWSSSTIPLDVPESNLPTDDLSVELRRGGGAEGDYLIITVKRDQTIVISEYSVLGERAWGTERSLSAGSHVIPVPTDPVGGHTIRLIDVTGSNGEHHLVIRRK